MDDVYPFIMSEFQGELMTREQNFYRMTSGTYGHMTKLFLESDIQHKGNKHPPPTKEKKKKKENASSHQNLAAFSAATYTQEIKLFKYFTKKGKKTEEMTDILFHFFKEIQNGIHV